MDLKISRKICRTRCQTLYIIRITGRIHQQHVIEAMHFGFSMNLKNELFIKVKFLSETLQRIMQSRKREQQKVA